MLNDSFCSPWKILFQNIKRKGLDIKKNLEYKGKIFFHFFIK